MCIMNTFKRPSLIGCILALVNIFIYGCQTQNITTTACKNWKVLSPIAKHVYGITTVVLDNKIHLLGGVHGKDWTDPIDFHQVYDPSADRWSLRAPIPDPNGGLGWAMATVYAGQIYLFGGGSGPGLEGSARVWLYDPTTDAWSRLADMPVERINGAAVTAGDYIYSFGGHRLHTPPADELISAYKYDPATDTYQRIENTPETATFITRAYYNGHIYAISGLEHEWLGQPEIHPSISYVYGQGVLKYNVRNDTWTKLNIPRIRQRTYTLTQLSSNPVIGSKLFVLGGRPSDGQRTNLAAYFDMQTETFGQIDSMPKGRCCGSAAVVDGKIYVSGGFWADVDDVYDCTETWGYPFGEYE